MTTKPSDAPWADEPFKLIDTPNKRLSESHANVFCASEMAHAHNVIIRGLNSILQQAPYVPDATSQSYKSQDVKDLLFYTECWVKMVNHHHSVEETFIFPEIEKFSGRPGIMDAPQQQHELFHDGLLRLLAYASATKLTPEEFRWIGEGGMKEVIDSFSQHLIDHLYAEIEIFLALTDVDGDGLRKTWKEAEDIAKKAANLGILYDIFPTVLGCADKTFEGGQTFPPLPWILPYLVKYWFAAGQGGWRFNPCDWWGQPQPLAFGPTSKGQK